MEQKANITIDKEHITMERTQTACGREIQVISVFPRHGSETVEDKLKTLEAQKTEAENLEIVQMVRALRLTPEQLNAMLSGGTVPGMAAASANYNEQEDTDHEE